MAIKLTYPEGCALVAGGTGSVGAGVTRRLAEAGLPVVFTYAGNEARAAALEAELREAGLTVWARRMEMRDPASIDAAIDFAVANGGRLHTVACAAGAPVPFNRIADFDIAEVERFFDSDGMAYYRLLHRVVPVLRAGGGGSITVTTTIATRRVIAYDGISPFSKGAVEALIRQLAAEEGCHGIRCNAVPIGWITNETIETMRAGIERLDSPKRERLSELIEQIIESIRLGRPGRPQEAGDLFAWLASDQASFVTGQSIAIDGGVTL
jgi:NAD(P)-dependent dehydrogenase (short-subunit alcohol dehydrogenase family)